MQAIREFISHSPPPSERMPVEKLIFGIPEFIIRLDEKFHSAIVRLGQRLDPSLDPSNATEDGTAIIRPPDRPRDPYAH